MAELENDTRPGLAIVANSITPYGLNLQRLVAAGIPELKLHVLISHWARDFDWQLAIPPEIRLTHFGTEGEHPLDNPLRRPLWDWRKGGRFIQYFRENNIRATILGGYRFISYGRLMNYCYRAKIPFFVNADSNIRNEPQLSPIAKFAKRRIYAWWMKRVTGVMSMGELGDEFFMKYGATRERLYHVPYLPDFDALARYDEVELIRFRQKYGLDGRRRYLLFSGRLISLKRVDLLIQAFSAIASERVNWDLLIVGDGVLRDELERSVPEAMRGRVIWTGFLEGSELALSYHATDALVLPSTSEAWSLVVVEAMAAGLTVASSDVVGAAHELVVDGVSGRIFLRDDLNSLQQALEDITHPEQIDRYRREARASFQAYRKNVDPVSEIRRALRDAGVLSNACNGNCS
jgi:glycosyltransferase involved in cell wall biosynthesis